MMYAIELHNCQTTFQLGGGGGGFHGKKCLEK